MTVKYAARGISTQMRTAEELLFTDGVTLKPVDGRDVFVNNSDNDSIHVGTNYNASTGGCTVDGVVYESEDDLSDSSYYVISSAFSAYNFSTETIVGIVYEGSYVTPNHIYCQTLSELVTLAGHYRTDTVPTQTPVWKISDGTAGTRYTGSLGDAVVKDAGGAFNYYATEAACDVVWTTEEPDPTYTAYSRSASYQSSNSTLNTTAYMSVYGPGEDGALKGDTHKDYVITGMWNANGADVYKEGVSLSCYLYGGNPSIRIRNKSGSNIVWNRIEYIAYDVFRIYLNETHTDVELNAYSQMNGCYNRNGSNANTRTPNETYTVVAAYQADGTPVDITPLQVTYNSSFDYLNVYNSGGYGKRTVAYVDFTVSGGDTPTTASALSLNNEEEM